MLGIELAKRGVFEFDQLLLSPAEGDEVAFSPICSASGLVTLDKFSPRVRGISCAQVQESSAALDIQGSQIRGKSRIF